MPHPRHNLGAIRFNLHPPAAAEPLLPPPQLAIYSF